MESSLENSTNEIGFFLKLAPLCLAEKKRTKFEALVKLNLGLGALQNPLVYYQSWLQFMQNTHLGVEVETLGCIWVFFSTVGGILI